MIKSASIPKYWFYVEPYVHLACKSDDCLVYNTLTGRALIYRNEPEIAGLVRRLLSVRNARVIRLNASRLEKGKIATFVKGLRVIGWIPPVPPPNPCRWFTAPRFRKVRRD